MSIKYKTLPERFYYLDQGYSAEEIYNMQRQKMLNKFNRDEKIKRAKEEMEQAIYDAMYESMIQSEEEFTEAAASDIGDMIAAAFDGGSIHPNALRNKSFAAQLGAALGKAPFVILDNLINDILDE